MSDERELLERIRRVRRELSDVGPDTVRGEDDFRLVALPAADGDALRDHLLAEQARVVIEIGLAYGSSALAIAEALASGPSHGAQHLIVDAFQDHFHDTGWNALVRAGVTDMCSLVRERSQLTLPALVAEGFRADAAFVDGSHRYDNVFVDLFYLRELVRPGGVVILDDCQWPSVATAVRYFELNAGWRPEPFARVTRLRAYRLPDPPAESGFENFTPFGLGDSH
jgi:predicted O-methyltransferase YrrM